VRVTIVFSPSFLPAYLQERKHLQTLPLDVLSDSRLGIDAAYYLQSLYDSPLSREPLLAATGGLPLGLTTRIESDLRTLEKLRIKPVFVFPGLTPNKRTRHVQRDAEQQDACRDRNLAWSKYESGQEEAATKLFEGRSGLTHWDLWRPVLRIFRNRNVEFLVAPYVAWAQVRYLHPVFLLGFANLNWRRRAISSYTFNDIKRLTSMPSTHQLIPCYIPAWTGSLLPLISPARNLHLPSHPRRTSLTTLELARTNFLILVSSLDSTTYSHFRPLFMSRL
jgi:hypothetical protein